MPINVPGPSCGLQHLLTKNDLHLPTSWAPSRSPAARIAGEPLHRRSRKNRLEAGFSLVGSARPARPGASWLAATGPARSFYRAPIACARSPAGHDFQQFDGRLAVTVDDGRAAVDRHAGRNAEQLLQVRAGFDPPQPEQVDFTQHVVRDQHPAQRDLLALHFAADFGIDVGKVQPHDAKLDHRSVTLPGQQNLTGIMLAAGPRFQHAHVDRRAVMPLDRHRHVVLMGQQAFRRPELRRPRPRRNLPGRPVKQGHQG